MASWWNKWKKNEEDEQRIKDKLATLGTPCVIEKNKVDNNTKINQNLNLAINNLDIELIKTLIQNGGDINKKDGNGNTPLMNIVMANNISDKSKQYKIIDLLLEKDADVYIKNNYNFNILEIMEHKEYYVEIRKIFEKYNYFKNTKSENDIYLLTLRNINIPGISEKTTEPKNLDENISNQDEKMKNENLFSAIKNSDIKLVKYLIENGEDINKKDNNGNTILMIAIMSYSSTSSLQQLELIRLLLENGANPYIENYKKLNARHIITSKGEIYKELRELFKEFNFLKNTEDGNNQYLSSLKMSNTIKIDSLETFNKEIKNDEINRKVLLEQLGNNLKLKQQKEQEKINIEKKRLIQKTQYLEEDIDKIKFIVEKQSKAIQDLMYAVNNLDVQLAQYLIENGADINQKDSAGNTPLINSVILKTISDKLKQYAIIELFLKKGADVYIKNKYNFNILEIMEHKEYYVEIRKIFEKYNYFKNTKSENDIYLLTLRNINISGISEKTTEPKNLDENISNQDEINIEEKSIIQNTQYLEKDIIEIKFIVEKLSQTIKNLQENSNEIKNIKRDIKTIIYSKEVEKLKTIIEIQSQTIKNFEDNLKVQRDKVNSVLKDFQTKQIEQSKIINEIKSNDMDKIKKEFENKQNIQTKYISELVKKIEKLEELSKNKSSNKSEKKLLNLPIQIEKQTINKIDGELIKRDSFDDF